MASAGSQFGKLTGASNHGDRRALLDLDRRERGLDDRLTVLEGEVEGFVESGTYTPTLTNVAVGTGGSAQNTAGYRFIGGTETGDRGFLMVTGSIVLGTSGASVSGAPGITLPTGFEIQTAVASGTHRIGLCSLQGTIGAVQRGGVGRVDLTALNLNGSGYLAPVAISATVPVTWAAGHTIRYDFTCSAIRV